MVAEERIVTLTAIQIILFSFPFLFSGFVHFLFIRNSWLKNLSSKPLDFGKQVRGRDLFGKNKTWRGLVVIVPAMTLGVLLEYVLYHLLPWLSQISLIDFSRVNPFLWGGICGFGYVLGELPNSFLKRQMGIPPGKAASKALGFLFKVADQIDGPIGVLILASPIWRPDSRIVFLLLMSALMLHVVGSRIVSRAI